MTKIYAHCLVKNEENFIWYAISSIIDFVDKALIWDNGSTDNTVQIIEELKKKWPSKISFKSFSGTVSEGRQQMLDETDAGWFIVLDGDEVWWEDSIKKLVDEINENGEKLDSIVVPFKNLVRDIFHYQEESKGKYVIDGIEGFITIRAINGKIPNLHLGNEYPQEGYFRGNTPIQNLDKSRRKYLNSTYLHLTHLRRSREKSDKIKNGLGLPFPLDYYYPEVFFRGKPDFIPSPWV